jgi:hypothetical protein
MSFFVILISDDKIEREKMQQRNVRLLLKAFRYIHHLIFRTVEMEFFLSTFAKMQNFRGRNEKCGTKQSKIFVHFSRVADPGYIPDPNFFHPGS